jgi:UDP-N-acetylmuramoyl-tripeptide--D-alanyl-D-alanine ligase
MKPLTLQQIRHAVAGLALTPAPEKSLLISAVGTDTRAMPPASLFIALRGPNFDGHDYLQQAAAAGAIAAMVEHPPATPVANLALIGVKDTLAAMGRLANFVRKQLRAKVIAVAGSNGKTGTKNLIAAAIGPKLRGYVSPKSFNNAIGVPLTIFAADPASDYLVVEIGTNHPGEIRQLTKIAQPDIAAITNCGAEHLHGLGDPAGVRRENATVLEGLTPGGCLLVYGDDPDLTAALAGYRGRRLTFGLSRSNDLFAVDVTPARDGIRFRLNDSRNEVFVPLLGRHNALNALAAIGVARLLKLDETSIIANISHAKASPMRLELTHHGPNDFAVTLLNDAYNANPDSTRAALQTLSELRANKRRIAVLGDMLELGPAASRYHQEIGQLVAQLAKQHLIDHLLCVGTFADTIADAAIAAGLPKSAVRRYPDAAAAAQNLNQWLAPGDLVLLKASRAVRLEIIAKAIAQLPGSAQRAAS